MSLEPRLFPTNEAIRHVGRGLLERTLPKDEWTHEAHLAAFAYLLIERPDISIDRDVPIIIATYNESLGGENTDTSGYHETITRCFIRGIRDHLARMPDGSLAERVNALLLAPEGKRDYPLRYYSRALLFSTVARRGYVEPDLTSAG